jgi:predicted  nucleic acid-binding Zn-ribbon protein
MKKLLKMNGETNFALIFTKVDQLSSIASDYTKLEKEKVDLIAAHTKELSSLKEQLNNKEIHIDLMRKKMVDLEEGKFGKSELKIDSESQLFNIKKLKVKIEKLNSRIDVLNAENVQLKSQLLDVSSLQVSRSLFCLR